MQTRLMADPQRYARMSASELRACFLLDDLFAAGEVRLTYCDADRAVVGAAVPTAGPLVLPTPDDLRAAYFTERRELGILNIGGRGSVTADGQAHQLDRLDCLYVGRGVKDVRFASADAAGEPARFYLLSYPAHVAYPTALAQRARADATHLGSEATANKRTIYKYIHAGGIRSAQLVMGFTQLDVGSVWNTMPPHTHMRRSEVYLYFDVAPDARVFHLMGPAEETRHLVVANEQAVVSPPWSIHAGAGTARYAFCWGMGGENQEFADMDALSVGQLK